MEKEKVRNPGPRERGQPGVPERGVGGSEAPVRAALRGPRCPPNVSSTWPSSATNPAGPTGHVQRRPRKRAAGTPAHLPAMPAALHKKRTGQILCPIRHFWEVVGNPLGWRERGRDRQKRHGSIETGTMSQPGRTTPAPQTAGRQDPARPCSHGQKKPGAT